MTLFVYPFTEVTLGDTGIFQDPSSDVKLQIPRWTKEIKEEEGYF